LSDVARNNLVLGTLQVLVDEPEVYPVFRLWLAVRDRRPVGVAMQTEPYNVLLAEPLEGDAVEALAEAVVGDGGSLPGVMANVPWADRFARRVATLTGVIAERALGESVWVLTTVTEVPSPGGAARAATLAIATCSVAGSEPSRTRRFRPSTRATTLARTSRSTCGSRGGEAATGCGRTARPSRCRGIAPSPELVRGSARSTHLRSIDAAAMPLGWSPSSRQRGWRPGTPRASCFTDMANTTSNALYARIGYSKVCEAIEYAFRPGAA